MLAVATPTGDPQLVESPGIAVVKNNTTATTYSVRSPMSHKSKLNRLSWAGKRKTLLMSCPSDMINGHVIIPYHDIQSIQY